MAIEVVQQVQDVLKKKENVIWLASIVNENFNIYFK